VTHSNEHDRRIAAMFDRIAPRYDLLNRVLSLGTDLSWRRRALDLARLGEDGHALDVGTGTGDFALALLARSPRSFIWMSNSPAAQPLYTTRMQP